MRFNLFITSFVFLSIIMLENYSFGQDSTFTIYASQDTYTDDYDPLSSFDTDTFFYVGTDNTGGTGYQRGFLDFDLSSIPNNVRIAEVKLILAKIGDPDLSNTFKASLVTESWIDSTVTHEAQPAISTTLNEYVTGMTEDEGVCTVTFTTPYREQHWTLADYEGIALQVSNETYSGQSGMKFYSSDCVQTSKRPHLEITYYYPHELANVNITHESDSAAADAIIDLDVLYGSQDFDWHWYNSSGTEISTDTILDSIGYGWYGLHIEGTGWSDEDFYYAFLVGTDCREVDIDFRTDVNYSDFVYTGDFVLNGVDYKRKNYDNTANFIAHDWNYAGGVWGRWTTFYQSRLWMDERFTVNKADLTLEARNHYINGFRPDNTSEFQTITEDWYVKSVTYNNSPILSDTVNVGMDTLTTSTEDATLDFTDFWNYWKQDNSQNHGVYYKMSVLDSTGSIRNQFNSGAVASSIRPLYEFTLDLTPQSYSIATWTDASETGSITVDIGEICEGTSPYFYYISNDSIPDFDSLYVDFQDTLIGGGVDSTLYYGMSTTDTERSYSNLEANQYFISVFDVNGLRIVDEYHLLQGDLEFDTQTGLSASGNRISSSQTNGVGSLKFFTHEDISSTAKLTLSDDQAEQVFGFMDTDDTFVDYREIEYGFYLNSGKLHTVENGVKSTGYTSISGNVELGVVNEQGTIKLLLDGVAQDTIIDTNDFELKLGFQLQQAYPADLIYTGMVGPKKKYRFMPKNPTYFDCSGTTGVLKFSIKKTWSSTSCPVTYSVVNPDGVTIVNSASTTTSTPVSISAYNGNPLIPGMYTVSGTIDCTGQSSISFSETVFLGYEVNWSTYTDYDIVGSHFLKRDATTLTYANGRASNILKFDEEGTIVLTPRTLQPGSINYFRFTPDNLDYQPTGNSLWNEDWLGFMNFGLGNMLVIHSAIDGVMYQENIGPYSTVRLEFTTTVGNEDVEVYVDDNLIQTISRGTSTALARANTLKLDDGFQHVVTSFGCPETEIMYAHLEYNLDGYYHVMKNGQINFIFDQEYDTDNLSFKIFDSDDQVVKTNTDFTAISTTHGANYLTIDVSATADCIGQGFFYLEVTNSKKEKSYIRFYNDLDQCN